MAEFNAMLMKNYNGPPTPKQVKAFQAMAKIPMPADISIRAGASCAIGSLGRYPKGGDINGCWLPSVCFCGKYTKSGIPMVETLAHKRYADGITVGMLAKAMGSLSKVKAAKLSDVSVHRHKMSDSNENNDVFDKVLIVRRHRPQ
jgi:hypothetical protein